MTMIDREKVINDLQDAVNDDWMWQHADYYAKAMENALALLKEQEEQSVLSNRVCEAEPFRYVRKGFCPKCHQEMEWLFNRKHCGFCGQAVKWG